jgi:sugar phosphate permease
VRARTGWLIWATAVLVYVAAVFHRCTLGVAGVEAAQRFGVGAAALGTFTVLQLLVYAAMQVPTGVLVDRFGPRAVLTAATLLMGLGQVLFAVAESYPLGLLARAVLGLGDAMTFVSVIRLVAAYFPARKFAVVVTLTAALGTMGNLVATVPLTLLLESAGWTLTFLVAGLATAAYSAIVLTRVRDVPEGATPARSAELTHPVLAQVREAWRVPGTRLGFWVHFSTMVTPAVLALLWGFPYLVRAHGVSEHTASSVLSVLVIAAGLAGPLIGAVISRRPQWRMPMVVGYLGAAVVLWALLLGWSAPLPTAVLAAAFGILALGMPCSAIGFAIARDYNPAHRVGTATGVVNVGGFGATTVAALGIGLILDQVPFLSGPDGFRIAFALVAVLLLVGAWRTAVWWRRARAAVLAAQARGEEVPFRIRHRRWDALPVPA